MATTATIIGAGIGGLAAALALHEAGFTVTIHERARSIAEQGTSLALWSDAMSALDAIGAGERIRDETRAHTGGSIRSPGGRVIAKLSTTREARIAPRPVLLNALLDEVVQRLGAEAILWGSDVESRELEPSGGLLIGADGINSLVRTRHWRGAAPRSLGTTALRGVVSGEPPEVTETWGYRRIFGITPHSPGHTNWFACARTDQLPPSATAEEHADRLHRLFGNWHPAVRNVIAQVANEPIDARPLYDLPRLTSFVRPGIALIGDAAHAMAPNLGRGACESLVDAAALGVALSSNRDLKSGLATYDRTRRGPSQRVKLGSRVLNRFTTGPLTAVTGKR